MSEDASGNDDRCPVCGHMYTAIRESAPDDPEGSVCEGEDRVYVHGEGE